MTKKDLALLTLVVAAMAVEATPYHLATEKEISTLLKDGMVETNPDIRDGDKIATRATEKGIAAMNEATTTTAALPASAASTFEIIKGVVLPAGRGGRTSNTYPFDSLETGDSFFVAATQDKPNPSKSIASTVSAATKRFAELIPGETRVNSKGKTVPATKNTRVFTTKAVKSGGTYGTFVAPADGALVQRTA